MSDLIESPKANPHLAAQQLVVELIRAGRLTSAENGKFIIATYEFMLKEFKRINAE